MGTVVLYGYALAGLGGYFFSRGRPDYILIGLGAGTLSAAAALFLWRKFLLTLKKEEEKGTTKNV
jgi:hypothetical protein